MVKSKNNKPLVAVLFTAFNGITWIEAQLKSILAQNNASVEIFISIDISKDKTYEWCCEFSKKNKNIIVLPYGKKFGGAAKNFFRLIRDVDFSRFDYVALSDQDDIWEINKIHHAIKTMIQNDLDGYSSDVIGFWSNGLEKLEKKSYPQKKYDYFFESAGPGCTYVLKKEPLLNFKQFLNENWRNANLVEAHDWLIYAYFRTCNFNWKIDNKPLMYYRQHNYNQVGLNYGFRAYLDRFKKIKSKWYRDEVLKIISLLSKKSSQEISLNSTFLIKNFWNLRRRPRDAIIFLFLNIFHIFI